MVNSCSPTRAQCGAATGFSFPSALRRERTQIGDFFLTIARSLGSLVSSSSVEIVMRVEPASSEIASEIGLTKVEPRLSGAARRPCASSCGLVCGQWPLVVGESRAVGPAGDPFNILRHVASSRGSARCREPARALLREADRRVREEPEKVRAEIQAYLASFASRPSRTMRTAARAPRARQPRCRRASRRQRRSTSRGGGSSSGDGSSSDGSSEDGAGSSCDPDDVGRRCRAAAAPILGCCLAHGHRLSSPPFSLGVWAAVCPFSERKNENRLASRMPERESHVREQR
jgi:hypothetical protein